MLYCASVNSESESRVISVSMTSHTLAYLSELIPHSLLTREPVGST